MTFRITPHAGYNAPPDALDMLLEQLGDHRDEMSFSKSAHDEIAVELSAEIASAMTQDERVETGRRQVLDMVRDICELDPTLDLDWFAISKMPDSQDRTW